MIKKKSVGQRGSDKAPRKKKNLLPAKDKAKVRSYSATDTEEGYIKKHFISTTKLVKGIVRKTIVVTKKK